VCRRGRLYNGASPAPICRFDRKLEKVVSLSAGIASAAFTQACGAPVHFDSRVWLGADAALVVDYFRWRQAEAARCALHGWCYWTLRQAGRSVTEATVALQGASVSDKNELHFQHGINFNDLPTWQRRGVGLYWQEYRKAGYDPQQQRAVRAIRHRLTVDQVLPLKDAYAQWLSNLLQQSRRPARQSMPADTSSRGSAGVGSTPPAPP
jgi:tRNA(His) guanylyltransferase